MNIVLIGYRGSGKSTVGMRIARCLEMTFVDTDDLLEKHHGMSISDMVKAHGWEYFRAAEKDIIKEVADMNHLVIAPGGGAVLDTDNVIALRKNGIILWLKADLQTLLKRMNQDPETYFRRPTLTGKGTLEELEEMISVREPFYQRSSQIQIDTSALEAEEVVEYVLTTLAGLNLNLNLRLNL